MVDAKVMTLSEVCTLITDGSHDSPESTVDGHLMPSVKDMAVDGFIFDKCKRISDQDYEYLVRNGCKPSKNDVLVAKDGSMLQYVFDLKEDLDIVLLSSIAILRPNTDLILPRYLVHYLRQDKFREEVIRKYSTKGGIPRIILSNFKKVQIMVPPLELQEEIVRILDSFTALTTELATELTARKKQYEFYRDKLLSFDDLTPEEKSKLGLRWVSLNAIASDIFKGNGIKRDQITESGTPCVRYGEIYTKYGISFDECISHTDEHLINGPKYFSHGDILFAVTGESVDEISKSTAYLGHERCLAGGDIIVLKHNEDPRYLSYVLSTTDAQKQKSTGKVKSKVVHAHISDIEKIIIPLPDKNEQKRLADILDAFNSLNNGISFGIPAEITARQKQYEYYRDKLLAFKEART